MSTAWLWFFGLAAGLIRLAALIPYIRDIFAGHTKPERSVWWVWSYIDIISFITQLAVGARWSLCLIGAQTVAALTVAMLSVPYGFSRFRLRNVVNLLFASAGLVLWYVTANPLLALFVIVAVDAATYGFLLHKAWQAPRTENMLTWWLAGADGIFGILSVGSFAIGPVLYPVYNLVGNWTMIGILLWRRRTYL